VRPKEGKEKEYGGKKEKRRNRKGGRLFIPCEGKKKFAQNERKRNKGVKEKGNCPPTRILSEGGSLSEFERKGSDPKKKIAARMETVAGVLQRVAPPRKEKKKAKGGEKGGKKEGDGTQVQCRKETRRPAAGEGPQS